MHGRGTPWLGEPRSISSSGEILLPHAYPHADLIGLVGSRRLDAEALVALGAIPVDGRWIIRRSDPFPFENLSAMLPRMARRTIVPEVVDLIPASSWFSSLANLLVGSSWSLLRDGVIADSGACEECGDFRSLEGHERWSYVRRHDAYVQRLDGIRCLCSRCHATQHLGRANVVGTFPGVFHRLCLMNRIADGEKHSYRDLIFDLFEERSTASWDIDLSWALRAQPLLKLRSCVNYGGDGWVWSEGPGDQQAAARIVGAQIASDGRRLVIVPEGSMS